MNQLIQELASKAFDKANDGTVDIKIPKQFIETFAQLVARRCIQCALDADDFILAAEMADLFGVTE